MPCGGRAYASHPWPLCPLASQGPAAGLHLLVVALRTLRRFRLTAASPAVAHLLLRNLSHSVLLEAVSPLPAMAFPHLVSWANLFLRTPFKNNVLGTAGQPELPVVLLAPRQRVRDEGLSTPSSFSQTHSPSLGPVSVRRVTLE